jgi:hypothetical protein
MVGSTSARLTRRPTTASTRLSKPGVKSKPTKAFPFSIAVIEAGFADPNLPVLSGDELKWEFDILKRDNPFAFKGFMANDSVLAQEWRFNLTDKCQSTAEDELLFSGRFLYPGNEPYHDWVDDSIPPVTIAGEFNDLTASIYIDGLFEGLGVNTQLAGPLSIRFSGQVDKDRSDRLLLDGREPAWEPVLGFREQDGDDDSGGISLMTSSSMALSASIFVLGLLSL